MIDYESFENETDLKYSNQNEINNSINSDEDSDIIEIAVELMKDDKKDDNNFKKRKITNDEYEQIELYCYHKKHGCYQCRSDYKGIVDIEYHDHLTKVFNKLKKTLSLIN